ncbi:MAG: glycosyltransferase family 2 protein [Opitutaceae bacterium]
METSLATVVLRSYNERWALEGTLAALRAQRHSSWELIAFDSGSTDGSVDLLQAANPRVFVRLSPRDYRPGRVLNQAMTLARTDRVIFLNADATPVGPDWLGPLIGALEDSRTAAVFGRQVPRPGCRAVFARDYERCFGHRRPSAKWDHFFSMVSSGLRRDVWALRGFREEMQYSEDDEYTRWCVSRGYTIRYCPESVVAHSHNYTPGQAYRRSFGEAWALAGMPSAAMRRMSAPAVFLGWIRDLLGDLRYCALRGRLGEWRRAPALRWSQRLGRLDGFRAGWRMHRVDGLL